MIDIGRFMDDGVGVKVKSVDTEYFYSTTTTATITTTKDIVDYVVVICHGDSQYQYLNHLFSVDKNGVKTVSYKDPYGVSGDFTKTDSKTITIGAPTNINAGEIKRHVWVTVEG